MPVGGVLAAGVGDLKRVLTNVRDRGGWGEVQLEAILERKKRARGVRFDTELNATDLEELVVEYKAMIRTRLGKEFPAP